MIEYGLPSERYESREDDLPVQQPLAPSQTTFVFPLSQPLHSPPIIPSPVVTLFPTDVCS
jgi:hypothetical protein